MDTLTTTASNAPMNGAGSRPIGKSRSTTTQSPHRPVGMWRALQLKWTAHWTERATEAVLRILDSQTRHAAKQHTLDALILETRSELAQAGYRAEVHEAELYLHRRLQSAEMEEARTVLQREIEIGMMLQNREAVRLPRQRVMLSVEAPLPALTAAEPTGVLEVHVSDAQIESLAVQAIARLGQMDTDTAEQCWSDWRQELRRKLPSYAADEVIRRADELRRMVR